MKEPILVTLIVQSENKNDFSIQLPLKKINSMYQIEKERLLRFLIKYSQILQSDKNKVCLEFFDFFNQVYVSEKYVTIQNNILQFSQKFLELPEQLVLKVSLYYNFSYQKLVQIDQAIEMFEIDKRLYQEQKIQYQNQFQEYINQFQEMKSTFEDIQIQISTYKQEKQLQNADIVILYSNPIIRVNNGVKESLFLDYQSEIENIQNTIIESGLPIKYQIFNATLNNLELAIDLHPIIIHIISHGDYDEKQAFFYLEFQDDGVSIKLKTDEIQDVIQNHKGNTRIKLICISSIAAKNMADYIPKTISWVVFKKIYNSRDIEGCYFWGEFYQKIFRDFTISSAFNSAKSQYQEKFWNIENIKNCCCCFHKHEEKCPFDPATIGFEISHKQHIPCSKQFWSHNAFTGSKKCEQKSYLGQFIQQCKNNCIGRIIHSCNNTDCQLYYNRIQTILQKLEIDQIDQDDLQMKLMCFGDQKLTCCCCDQQRAVQSTVELNNLPFEVSQHTYDQKIAFYLSDEKINNLKFSEKVQNILEKQTEIQFIKIDKQIIFIHSLDEQNEELRQKTVQTVYSYFDIYFKQISYNKQIKNINLNFNNCNVNNWMEYVSNILNFQSNNLDEFLSNLKQYFKSLKSQESNFYIFLINNIINIYESDQFKLFYEEVLKVVETSFILIFTLSNVQKDHLKKIVFDKQIQLIDLNQIQSLLDAENTFM